MRSSVVGSGGWMDWSILLCTLWKNNQFKSAGLLVEHIHSLFNPDDQQDIKIAFDMLKDIWSLLHSSTNSCQGFLEAWEALWVLGKLLYHMIFLFLCVDLSLRANWASQCCCTSRYNTIQIGWKGLYPNQPLYQSHDHDQKCPLLRGQRKNQRS